MPETREARRGKLRCRRAAGLQWGSHRGTES